MELRKTGPTYYFIILGSVLMLFALGTWWLYLVFRLAFKLESLNHPLLQGNLLNMIKWEGVTFFVLLFIVTIILLYLYWQDLIKTKSMQAFFASLTHELKTPLASMNLQTQVLQDQIESLDIKVEQREKLNKYMGRLITDGHKLENQLDNHLQLSRVERKAPLNLRSLDLKALINHEYKKYKESIILVCQIPENFRICADDFAVQTIIKNIFENSVRHNKSESPSICFKKTEHNTIEVSDNGSPFLGDLKKLGLLFYKYESPKGSGIGLYLMKKLMRQMNGSLQFKTKPNLVLVFKFKQPIGECHGK